MYLGNTITNKIEFVHWALKRLLQNSFGNLCSHLFNIWDAMNNMIMLQHTEIKASFETSIHVIGHVFKVTLYKRLLDMVSRYALNQITAEFENVHYAGKNPSRCECVMRTTHGPIFHVHVSYPNMFLVPYHLTQSICFGRGFLDQGLSKPQVTITEEMETISKQFEKLDVCGKVTLKSKLWEIAYPDLNSMCHPPEEVNAKGAQKKSMTKHQRSTKHDPS
ncbi:hypothetical protein GmHk_03G006550 [Glycine max]|nr:hypothetical protein GmHk_03G006550 [Glycine max]